MGQFKPMVKMMTDEPSVILKLKKGGKVAKKADGGFMPMASTQPAGLPARGGMAPSVAPMAPSMAARRRAMMAAAARPAMNPTMMKKGGKAEKHEDAAEDRAMIKKAMAGKKFASGGKIDAVMDKTTVKGNERQFVKTDMETADRTTKVKGTGKGVKVGNGGGYAAGGTIEGNAGNFAKTKVVDGDKNNSVKGTGKGVKMGNGGGYADGGAIKGGNWENRPADTAKPGKSGGETGGVRKGNAGGYKMGGAAKKKYATGGNVVDDGRAVAMPKKHLSQPIANSLQSGTFKKGGKVNRFRDGDSVTVDPTPCNSSNMRRAASGGSMRKYADGGFVNPSFPQLPSSTQQTIEPPVQGGMPPSMVGRNMQPSMMPGGAQPSPYKRGGKVRKFSDGDLVDASKGAYDKSIGPDADDLDLAKTIRSIPKKLYEGAKGMMGFASSAPKAGSITKTEKSVTVSPKKRGGRC